MARQPHPGSHRYQQDANTSTWSKSNPYCTSFTMSRANIYPLYPLSLTTSTGESRIPSQYSAAATFHCSKGQASRPALLSLCTPFTRPHDSCDRVTSFLNLSGSMSVFLFFFFFLRHRILKCHFVMRGLRTTTQL